MTSLEIIKVKETIKTYLYSTGHPKELSRLIVKEIYEELQREALEEAISEAKEGENNG